MNPTQTMICLSLALLPTAGSAIDGAAANGVLALSGGTAHLEVEDAAPLHGFSALTMTAWIRANDLQGWQAVFWKGDQPDGYPYSNREFGLFLHGGSLHLSSTPTQRQQRGHLYLNTPGTSIQADRWHHVAAVLHSDAQGGAMRIYVDGELVASRPYERGGIRDSVGPLWIGGIPGRGAAFDGRVDEVQLWHRALTGNEIRAGMRLPRRGDEPGLIAYYRFDDPTPAAHVRDLSYGAHHGRLVAGAQLQPAAESMLLASVPMAAPVVASVVGTVTTTTTTTTTTTPAMTAPGAPVLAVLPAVVAAEPDMYGLIGGQEAELVVEAIEHHDAQVRREAVRLIPRLEPAQRLEVLRRAIHSHDAVVRRHAASLLTQSDGLLEGPAAPLLLEPVALGVMEKEERSATDRSRYHGWEHKWSAEGPDFWGLEQQGPQVRYNRVEGLFLGWRQARSYRSPTGLAHYGEIGRGLASERWRWQAGGELFTWYGPPRADSHLASVGLEVHDLTDSEDNWLISQDENSLASALLRRDFRDHYHRRGGSLYTTHNVGGVLQVGARWARDRFSSMDTATGWALFNNGWSSPVFRDNPEIDTGDVVSVRADVQLDTRSHVGAPARGWFVNAFAERSGGVLGGDYRFKRYLLDMRRYQPMGPGTRLDLRLRGATAKGDLPQQYVYHLGGFGSVRGYGFKAFSGDRSVLINTQYWVNADRHWSADLPFEGMGFGAFFDAGAAWFAKDRSDPFTGLGDLSLGDLALGVTDPSSDVGSGSGPRWKRALGLAIGTSDEGVRFEFTRALDQDPEALNPQAAGWSMTARISRAF